MAKKREREQFEGRKILCIGNSYGDDSVKYVREIAEKVKRGEINPSDIDEDMISDGIYTADQPDPDLIIRPSGEYRLSNFLLWQSAYAELYIDDVLWPDYTPADLDRAIEEYSKRNRRFGGV